MEPQATTTKLISFLGCAGVNTQILVLGEMAKFVVQPLAERITVVKTPFRATLLRGFPPTVPHSGHFLQYIATTEKSHFNNACLLWQHHIFVKSRLNSEHRAIQLIKIHEGRWAGMP